MCIALRKLKLHLQPDHNICNCTLFY
uniref:Uncharacterized protein n=1 Tax=Anguilla anguilla TaxID=7936 RepID=A0A0E9W0V9_ANGAN